MRNYPTTFVLTSLAFLILLGSLPTSAELNPGVRSIKQTGRRRKGWLPDSVLRRFQEGKYQAKIITLPDTLGWGSKFKAATETNAGQVLGQRRGLSDR